MGSSRHFLAFVVSFVICVVAIWREMQVLAIVALVASLAVVYSRQAKLLFEQGLELVSRTKSAKLGNVEVQVKDKVVNITERFEQQAKHLRVLLDGLDGDHLGWLLEVHKVGRYQPTDAVKGKLRPLRDRGLLTHDGLTMAKASHVWLTALGEELAGMLLVTTPELQQAQPVATSDGQSASAKL